MTNGDRIRQMSNEELAGEFFNKLPCQMCEFKSEPNCSVSSCKTGIKAYLESEVE